MARLGAFCFAGTGHINPLTALACRLQQHGHEVIVFGIRDIEARVRAAGIGYCPIGESDYPAGTLERLDAILAQKRGLETFRFTVDRVKRTAMMELRDGPEAVRRTNIDALLIDEADMGGSIADHLGLPFLSIAFFPPLIRSDRIPPFFFGWRPGQGWISRLRNRLATRFLSRLAAPVYKEVNAQRGRWGLKPLLRFGDGLSPLAQITQLPAALEFKVDVSVPRLHYTGPFVDQASRSRVEFPWGRLDDRPLIYASLGTLQNGAEDIFRKIAAACVGLHAQLVISLGGGLDPGSVGVLPGQPLIVRYAPQLDLLQRATLVITHAGLNTTLESLAEGVPLVCIPLGNDQPGVAARVAAAGAGIVISRRKLSIKRLRSAITAILSQPHYRASACGLQTAMRQIDGLEEAAKIIDAVLGYTVQSPDERRNHLGQPALSQSFSMVQENL